MANYERPTLKQLNDRVMADIASRLGGMASLLRRAWARVMGSVFAAQIHLLYGYISWALDQFFVQTAGIESLVKKGEVYNIVRYSGTYSTGFITVTGTQGILIEEGTVFTRSDGFRYVITEDTAIGAAPTDMPARAAEVGTIGNAAASTLLNIESPIVGVQSEANVSGDGGFIDGVDLEDVEDFRQRILYRMQEPPQGGAKSDYTLWAKGVPGVGIVMVYGPDEISKTLAAVSPGPPPITPPPNNVWVYFSEANGTTPSAPRILQVYNEIRSKMPVTAVLQVFGIVKISPTIVINAHPQAGSTESQMRSDIIDALTDLFVSSGLPGQVIFPSQLSEAISSAPSEAYHEVVTPTDPIVLNYDEIARIDETLVTINAY